MSDRPEEQAQGHAGPPSDGLVEQEGVNAGAAGPGDAGPGDAGPGADVRRGGHPERAADQDDSQALTGGARRTSTRRAGEPGQDEDDAADAYAGAPEVDAAHPGAPHGSSGQDAGLMS